MATKNDSRGGVKVKTQLQKALIVAHIEHDLAKILLKAYYGKSTAKVMDIYDRHIAMDQNVKDLKFYDEKATHVVMPHQGNLSCCLKTPLAKVSSLTTEIAVVTMLKAMTMAPLLDSKCRVWKCKGHGKTCRKKAVKN